MGQMNVYIAATRQNDGKTMVSLGLLSLLRRMAPGISYMKPVGQQYQIIDNQKIDKDAVLMKKIFGFKNNLSDMSPIAIPAGFTEEYILKGKRSVLENRIKKAYKQLVEKSDFILIEGTGHAGVGSVFDLSNAEVSSLLGAKVVIVSGGGLGRPIDEIMLNKAKFDQQGVAVLGVIVNKVMKDKYNKINRLIRLGMDQKKIEVFGVIPFEEVLSNPTVAELFEDLGGRLICGYKRLANVVERFIIGDIVAHETLNYLSAGTLLIVPGNREDIIYSALSGWVLGLNKKYNIAGIIATYGKKPHKKVVEIIERANIPLILVKEDSFSAACRINNMIFKIRAEDKEKIKKTVNLIEKYVDSERLFKAVRGIPEERKIFTPPLANS
ncbi:MAG: AAA family ATPase [Elusimicrobia bacterium]|nr:AAA family ATPase [Elusimicrobiota bacterium]